MPVVVEGGTNRNGGVDKGTATWTFETTPRISSYITAVIAGPYHAEHRELTSQDGRIIPLGVYCRGSLAEHLDTDNIVDLTRAGLRLLRARVRRPVPVHQVRPALRARVQRRGDGERRRGDVPRVLRVPVQGPRGHDRAPRRHDPARAGAHVVRRPGDHALVGRPVAERVVRRVHVDARHRARPPAGPAPGPRSPRWRRTGPTGRTSCPPRTRSSRTCATWRTSRSTSTASPTPRARACSSSWCRGWARTSSSPASAPTSPSTRGATPSCATSSPSSRPPAAATCPPGPASGWRQAGVTLLRPEIEVDDAGRHHLVRRPAGGARRAPRAAPAPPRDRRLRPRRRRAGWCGRSTSSSTSTARAPRSRSWSACSAPTLAAGQRRRPRLRQGPPRRAVAGRRRSSTSASSTTRCPARSCGPPPGTRPATARPPPATSSTWC